MIVSNDGVVVLNMLLEVEGPNLIVTVNPPVPGPVNHIIIEDVKEDR